MLSVRVVTVDHYTSKPIKQLSGARKSSQERHWSEPVIRIFGPTNDGIKTCVHIHGVYPYMYVPYRGGENPERDALLLGAALDQALAANSKSKNPRFVYKVILTSGIPLYGYHSRPRQFFKIFFFNPYHIRRASDLLLSGAILGQRFQPHEAHIPFTLQFMIDYNIYGMSFIHLEKVKHRRSPADPGSLEGIDESHILPAHVKRTTHSHWEVDALAEDILNNRSSRGSLSVNPGLEAIWEDERNRRRGQERSSQITQQASESRPEVRPTANEEMHRQRLAQRLRDVAVEVRETSPESGPQLSYPAEVPEDAVDMLEASVVGAVSGADLPPVDLLGDVSELIDERLLTEMVGAGCEEGEEEEEARIEEDSVLGRNQRDEEEAELDEDGGDMTQPLEMLERLESAIRGDRDAIRDERGENSESEFWRNMADKIMQLDGADDPSSMESDEENRRTLERSQCQQQEMLSKEAETAVDGMLGSSSPGSESISNWSNSIMSILNEGGGFSVQPAAYPTSQAFWSSWSPRMSGSEPVWPAQSNGEAWTWDRADSAFLDCLSYPAKRGPGAKATDGAAPPPDDGFQAQQPTGDAGEVFGFPSAQGDYFHGNYTPTSTMSPLSTVGSVYNISPPSAILTPSSEMDSYSDVNLDSVCETASQLSNSPSPGGQDDGRSSDFGAKAPAIESKTVTLPKADVRRSSLSPGHRDVIDVLKRLSESRRNPEQADSRVKMAAVTLKQYIKTCGDIVNVDFKSLSGKDMVVIEYRPLNSKSNQNKYLIKPLDKFLEEWSSTEEKLNNARGRKGAERGRGEWPRLINGFPEAGSTAEEEQQLSAILSALENKYTGTWLDDSKIKSIKNKFVVKSMEMLPEGGEGVPRKVVKSDGDKSYKVNENVISEGKIKMRLIKERRGVGKGEDDGQQKATAAEPPRPSNCPSGCRKKQNKSPGEEDKVRKLSFGKFLEKERAGGRKWRGEGASPSGDSELMEQINRSFEDYFRTIVKVNGSTARNEAPPQTEDAESSSGEEDGEGESDAEAGGTPSTEAIRFVTQVLSVLSSFSRSSTVPPLSITINFGGGGGGASPSVQFNLQTGGGAGAQRKRRSKKLTINNLDGPADTSSSEESLEGKPAGKTPTKKKARKDLSYRPLNVVIQKTPGGGALSERKRKLPSARNLAEELMAEGSPCSDGGAAGVGGGGGSGGPQKHHRASNKRGRSQAADQAQSKKSKLRI